MARKRPRQRRSQLQLARPRLAFDRLVVSLQVVAMIIVVEQDEHWLSTLLKTAVLRSTLTGPYMLWWSFDNQRTWSARA